MINHLYRLWKRFPENQEIVCITQTAQSAVGHLDADIVGVQSDVACKTTKAFQKKPAEAFKKTASKPLKRDGFLGVPIVFLNVPKYF